VFPVVENPEGLDLARQKKQLAGIRLSHALGKPKNISDKLGAVDDAAVALGRGTPWIRNTAGRQPA